MGASIFSPYIMSTMTEKVDWYSLCVWKLYVLQMQKSTGIISSVKICVLHALYIKFNSQHLQVSWRTTYLKHEGAAASQYCHSCIRRAMVWFITRQLLITHNYVYKKIFYTQCLVNSIAPEKKSTHPFEK